MGATYNGFAGIRDYAQFYIDSLKNRAMHINGLPHIMIVVMPDFLTIKALLVVIIFI